MCKQSQEHDTGRPAIALPEGFPKKTTHERSLLGAELSVGLGELRFREVRDAGDEVEDAAAGPTDASGGWQPHLHYGACPSVLAS